MNQNWHNLEIFWKKLLLIAYRTLKHSLSTMKINYRITPRSRSTSQNLESTMWLAKFGKGMLFSVEQAFVRRDDHERWAPLKMLAWEATKTTEQHGNFNLFYFQYDRMWQVKMTGKTKGWQVNSPNAISLDIVCWPAVISSPVKPQGKCWKDDVVNVNSTSKGNSQMPTKMQAKSSFASIPTWWSIQFILLCWKVPQIYLP